MRLIDADKLSYEAELCIETTDAFQDLIEEQPTIVDRPKITICKDCIFKENITMLENVIYCPRVRMRVPIDWFCADGKDRNT